jgi:hypothetical protein
MEKLKRRAPYGGRQIKCAHFICLPPFLPADFKEQAGRTKGFHNDVCDLSKVND